TVTISIVKGPDWLTFQASETTGTLTGTPGEEHVGGYTVTLRAIDELGASSDLTFSITVKREGSSNEPPKVVSAVPEQLARLGGASVAVDLSSVFIDADGDPLTLSVSPSEPDIVDVLLNGET